ncbi:MAG: HEAT repeat domain-containing protein [bacterium]|nr:HEAT repeat domain-containing protein [bacterium]
MSPSTDGVLQEKEGVAVDIDQEEIQRLIDDCHSNDPERALPAMNRLSDIKDLQALGPLVFLLLANDKMEVRRDAVWALGKINVPEILRPITDLIVQEKDPDVLAKMIWVVGKMGDEGMLQFIEPHLKDENPRVRSDAVEALERLGGEKVVDRLTPYLQDDHHRVKTTTAMVLAKYGGLRMISILKDMLLEEERVWHRAAAAFALGQISGIHVVEPLMEALTDESPEVVRNVVKALGKTGETSFIPDLILYLDNENATIRANTTQALGELNDGRAVDPLMKAMLKDADEKVREKAQQALVVLAESGVPSVKGMFVVLHKNSDPEIRRAALLFLGETGDIEVLPFLEKAIANEEDAQAREAAQKALGKLKASQEKQEESSE